ncbi:MAG TPA: type II toxin-antitoxin system death-on-curing family toxin [Acidimicrobiales bacterium]
MSDPVEYLDLDDLVVLATRLFGRPPPIRDAGLLGSAAARPQTTLLGEDAYPDIWGKAAALLQSIVKNHPLIDGNKRLGWLATATFLEVNGVAVTGISNDDVVAFVTDIAAACHGVDELAASLRRLAECAAC